MDFFISEGYFIAKQLHVRRTLHIASAILHFRRILDSLPERFTDVQFRELTADFRRYEHNAPASYILYLFSCPWEMDEEHNTLHFGQELKTEPIGSVFSFRLRLLRILQPAAFSGMRSEECIWIYQKSFCCRSFGMPEGYPEAQSIKRTKYEACQDGHGTDRMLTVLEALKIIKGGMR